MEKVKVKPLLSVSEIIEAFERRMGFQNPIKWSSAIAIILYHVAAVYWCYHYAFPVKWRTVGFAIVMYLLTGFGRTGGAHRLWTHRAYKATTPLKLFLLMCFAASGQNTLYQWVRDHRVHHKHSDTDADPHNARRGLFFSHIGWWMLRKNQLVLQAGKQIDMSDITGDPLLRYFNKYFMYLKLLFCYAIPLYINVVLLGETWQCTVAWQFFIRFLSMVHSEMTINSLAHFHGYRPYNKNIVPRENRYVAMWTFGEGWHNYHHAFPFDYKAAEFCDVFNWCTAFIRFFNAVGWAYDLREPTPDMIRSIASRLGDGTEIHNTILEKSD